MAEKNNKTIKIRSSITPFAMSIKFPKIPKETMPVIIIIITEKNCV